MLWRISEAVSQRHFPKIFQKISFRFQYVKELSVMPDPDRASLQPSARSGAGGSIVVVILETSPRRLPQTKVPPHRPYGRGRNEKILYVFLCQSIVTFDQRLDLIRCQPGYLRNLLDRHSGLNHPQNHLSASLLKSLFMTCIVASLALS